MQKLYTALVIVLLLINLMLVNNESLLNSTSARIFQFVLILALLITALLWVKNRHRNKK